MGIPKTFLWVNTTLNSFSHIYLTGTTISPTKFIFCLLTEKHYPSNTYTMLLHTNRVTLEIYCYSCNNFFGCKVLMITAHPTMSCASSVQFSCSQHYYVKAKLSMVQFLFLPTPVLQPDSETDFPNQVLTTVLTKIQVFWDVILS